jgi:Cu+-exporting ATPase
MERKSREELLRIEGMTCASCVHTVEKALASVPGIEEVVVNLATEEATLTTASDLPASILKAGGEGWIPGGYDTVS